MLLGALHLFNLAPALAVPGQVSDDDPDPAPIVRRPIIAWGAGAMALTERVLLFYDNAVDRPGVAEMLMEGLGLTRDVVALPSPRDRLDLRNADRMATMARRAAPARCLLLDVRAEVTLTAAGRVPDGARVLGLDGVAEQEESGGHADLSETAPQEWVEDAVDAVPAEEGQP